MELPNWTWFLVLVIVFSSFLSKRISSRFLYHAKFTFFLIYMLGLTFISLPYIILLPRKQRNLGIFVPYIQPISKLLGIEWDIRGAELMATDFPCVVIMNHQSCLDGLALMEVLGVSQTKKMAIIGKREAMYLFPAGFAAWLCGAIFIDRSNGPKAIEKIDQKLAKYTKENVKIFIFPEGTRHQGQSLLPFKKGAFHIAHQNKLPIVPVVISPANFIDHDAKVFRTGTIAVSILEPISTESLQLEKLNSFVDTTRETMNEEFQRLCKEFN